MFDEVDDFPVFVGNILVAIDRLITHVTEVGTKQCEQPRCRYTLIPDFASFSPIGGQGNFQIVPDSANNPDDQCQWIVSTSAAWIVLDSPTTGSGAATFNFSVQPNPSTTPRYGEIRLIGDDFNLPFTVSQSDNPLVISLTDPATCLSAGKTVGVTAYLSNNSAVAQSATFSATLPPQLIGLSGSCSSTVGNCTVTATTINWTGTLAAGQVIPINYQAQIANGTPNGATLTINNSATINGQQATLPYSFVVNCPNPASVTPTFCNFSSFVAPLVTRGLSFSGERFLLPTPLTLTITSADAGGQSFAVTEQSFGSQQFNAFNGLLTPGTQGLRLSTPGGVMRAVSCLDSFRALDFEIASTGAPGDQVRLFLQDEQGGNPRELAVFTVQADGQSLLLTALHPEAQLWLGNRLASGPGQFTPGTVILLNEAAGASGRRTGLLTLGLSGSLTACAELGVDLRRAGQSGSMALVFTDLEVNRTAQSGDANRQARGLIGGQFDSFPTAKPCRTACPVCPPVTRPSDCAGLCFPPPSRLRSTGWPAMARVWSFGQQILAGNSAQIAYGLADRPGVVQQLNRHYLAAQLSLLKVDQFRRERALQSALACHGLSFAPVTLKSDVTLAPSSRLEELMAEAQQVTTQHDWAEAEVLIALFNLLNHCQGGVF